MNDHVLQRRFERERTARLEAEKILEDKAREIFMINQALKNSADKLKTQNRKTESILKNASDGIVTMDDVGIIQSFNPAAQEIFGVENYSLQHPIAFHELFQPEESEKIEELLSKLNPGCIELTVAVGDQENKMVEVNLGAIEDADQRIRVAVIRDRTEVKRLESQYAQAQKLESVGKLAAGVAHEINTPIQFIGDNVSFVREALDDLSQLWPQFEDLLNVCEPNPAYSETTKAIRQMFEEYDIDFLKEEIPSALRQTMDGTKRVAKIVRAMKEFSHPGGEHPIAIDVNDAINCTLVVSRNEWKYVAESKLILAEDLPKVLMPAGYLNQVLLNLVVNSAHAIDTIRSQDRDFQGIIEITTEHVDQDVIIRVADNGCGIPEEIIKKVFDPFFTTKPVGKGTGQGLTLVHDLIVKKLGGVLELDSVVGQGTTITLKLPTTKTAEVSHV